jgi:hypothetical protein
MTAIEVALVLLLVHALLGGFDTLYNHEWVARLPKRPGAAAELALHSMRSLAFATIYCALAWFEWHGVWGAAIVGLIAFEYGVTLADSVVEDRTRRLSAIERINHMLLGLNTGFYTAFVVIEVAVNWRHRPTALVPTYHGVLSWLVGASALGVAVWAARDALAALRLRQVPAPR